MGRQGNWLERHAKKIVFFLVVLIIGGMALVTEKILAYRAQPNIYYPGIKRFVKLRESRPLYSDVLIPPPNTMEISDSLVRKGYPFRIDDNGFIMPSKIHVKPQLTLAFLGGSTTECAYVEEENRFPYLVGRLVEKKTGLRTDSYNAGKAGNTSLHSLDVLLNKVIPVKPDVAIMMHNVNDLAVLIFEKTFWTKNPYRSPLVEIKPSFKTAMKSIEESFHIMRDLYIPHLSRQLKSFYHYTIGKSVKTDEFKQARGHKIPVDKHRLVSEFSMNLQMFIDISRARKITPVLMTMANRLKDDPDPFILSLERKTVETGTGLNYKDFKELVDLFNQTIREVAAANNVLVIDLDRKVPKEKELMYDFVHLNDAGSKYVSDIIAAELYPIASSLKMQHH
ncbi:MAG: SGNH/GDSL hydrolase family protein [Deltaproteobacteria bacterium]|nr:SGNH/GDSL hydrolase family protein [Deltaproteobacteria bacterium]